LGEEELNNSLLQNVFFFIAKSKKKKHQKLAYSKNKNGQTLSLATIIQSRIILF